MIKGEFKKEINSVKFEKNSVVFVFSGVLIANGEKIESGKGFFCDDISENSLKAHDLTYLSIEYTGKNSARLIENIGQNNIFDFTISDELVGLSELFFGGGREYDNEMLSSGIAQTVFSYIDLPSDSDGRKTTVSQYVLLAESYIDENMACHIKIDDVASYLGLSRGYLRNIFFEQKGISPQEYLMQKRIETAQNLLGIRDISIGEVAKRVGYDDILQFSRIFKKRTGISPTEYRKQNAVSYDSSAKKSAKTRHIGNNNNINKNKNKQINVVLQENAVNTIAEKEKVNESVSYDSAEDLTAILAAQIEKAARAAEKEREEKEKAPSAPLWLL